VAKIAWTRRRQAIAIVAVVLIDFALAIWAGDIAAIVVMCEAGAVAVVGAAMLIERSLHYALTTAPAT
jgi:hypothetical protein